MIVDRRRATHQNQTPCVIRVTQRVIERDRRPEAVAEQRHALDSKRLPQCLYVIGHLGHANRAMRLALTRHVGAAVEVDDPGVTAQVRQHRVIVFMRQARPAVQDDDDFAAVALCFVQQLKAVRFELAVSQYRRPDVMVRIGGRVAGH